MSDSPSRLPARPSLEQLQKQAKELLRQLRAADSAAIERFRQATSRQEPESYALADSQFTLARELGFETWAKLKQRIAPDQRPRHALYEELAEALVAACAGDADAMERLHEVYGGAFPRSSVPFAAEAVRKYVDERLGAIKEIDPAAPLALDDARLFLARLEGFRDWQAFVSNEAPAAHVPTPAQYRIDWISNTIEVGPIVESRDWDSIVGVIKEHGLTGVEAGGRMTDSALRRISKLGHVTRLNLGGCLQLTDDGLVHLAQMKKLKDLDISGWKGQITDRGLEALVHLTELRKFQICWQQHVSDDGLQSLRSCEHLEDVNLLGTPAGDGTIEALAGKRALRRFRTGRGVTDSGIDHLHRFPNFKTWQGGEIEYGLMGFDAGPTFLLLDGPFTDAGLTKLAGLDGLFGLTFFWHCPGFTSNGLAGLKQLPKLGFLGCQDAQCDDGAMREIAAIPDLRMLMGQGAVATDDGFAALSRSPTIEYIWGRECPNLASKGFAALEAMPALRGLAVSCANVDDAALSALPRFPALRGLMPMDVQDEGFRHIGRCQNLESLWCMYCRETSDAATEHISGLPRLKTYYAGKTKITDRSLEILGRMTSLEKLEFWHCLGLTNAGVVHLAALPRLKEITIDGSPGVTRDAIGLFGPNVRVKYSA